MSGSHRSCVRVAPGKVSGRLRVPGSKSYTHRALVVGALSDRPTLIRGPLRSDDTLASRSAVEALGHEVRDVGTAARPVWKVSPGGLERNPGVDARESGTTLRLFTGAAATLSVPVRFSAGPRLSMRPMAGLLAALRSWGATVNPPPTGRSCPFTVRGPLAGGSARVPASMTSQFVSSLLMAAPRASRPCHLSVIGRRVSEPYVEATLRVLAAQGIEVRSIGHGYRVNAPQSYRGRSIKVPGDASSAAYLFAAAALTGGDVTVEGLDRGWPQADLVLLDVLRTMGVEVQWRGGSVRVHGPSSMALSSFHVGVDDAPDLAPLLGVLAAFAKGPSEIRGGRHLAVKESDRREGTARLARTFGARVNLSPGRAVVRPGRRPTHVDLRDEGDHRLVMSAAVGAAALEGVSTLGDVHAPSKSYPGFFDDLAHLGVGIDPRGSA